MSDKPNILFFICDDTDFHNLGCYGGSGLTPNIDSLVNTGIRFDDFHTPSPVCTPSRYCALTGQYPANCRHPAFTDDNPHPDAYRVTWNTHIDENEPCVGRLLSKAGYQTGFAGKHHAGDSASPLPLPTLNADDDPTDPEVDRRLRQYQQVLCEHMKQSGGFDFAASVLLGNPEEFPVKALQHHNLEWIGAGAHEFFNTMDKQRPFYLHVASTVYHGPWHDESYSQDPMLSPGGKLERRPDFMPDRATARKRLQEAGLPFNHRNVGMVWMDDLIGSLIERLKKDGLYENTLFVFCSDHNTEPGKATCHIKGTRIPAIVSWPNKFRSPQISNKLASHVDWLPTFLELSGSREKPNLDGVSMLPLFESEQAEIRSEVYSEMGYAHGVFDGRYNLIALCYPESFLKAVVEGKETEAINQLNMPMQHQPNISIRNYPAYFDPLQLFDLKNDPHEQVNLANLPEYAEIVDRLKNRLREIVKPFPYELSFDVRQEYFGHPNMQKLIEKTRGIGTGYIDWWPQEWSWDSPCAYYGCDHS